MNLNSQASQQVLEQEEDEDDCFNFKKKSSNSGKKDSSSRRSFYTQSKANTDVNMLNLQQENSDTEEPETNTN